MKIAVQIPIKAKPSTRVSDKNFRDLSGKEQAFWLLGEVAGALPEECDVFIDSEDETVMEPIIHRYGENLIRFYKRDEWYTPDEANGNHLLNQFGLAHSHYNLFIQLFVTAVTLPGSLIVKAVEKLWQEKDHHDSLFLVTEETRWIWYKHQVVNYLHHILNGLSCSQDATYLKETTDLYAIFRESLLKTSFGIEESLLLYHVSKKYALDIETLEDLEETEYILKNERHLWAKKKPRKQRLS